MKRTITVGLSSATLALMLTLPAHADDDARSLRHILNKVLQFERGYGPYHPANRYDDDDGRFRGYYDRRHSHSHDDDDYDDDDDGRRRAGHRGGGDDDDD